MELMHSVHYEILTEVTLKDDKVLWSHVGFGVTGSQGYVWRVLWLLWRASGPINISPLWWPVYFWQPKQISFRLLSTPFSMKMIIFTNMIFFSIGWYKAGILCLAVMKFQRNNARQHWSIFLLSVYSGKNFFFFNFFFSFLEILALLKWGKHWGWSERQSNLVSSWKVKELKLQALDLVHCLHSLKFPNLHSAWRVVIF